MEATKRIYIFSKSKNYMTVLGSTGNKDKDKEHIRLTLNNYPEDELPDRIVMGEEAYECNGEPSVIYGLPVSVKK